MFVIGRWNQVGVRTKLGDGELEGKAGGGAGKKEISYWQKLALCVSLQLKCFDSQ